MMDLAWLPNGSKIVSASRDRTAKVFDARTGDSLVTFNGHAEPVFGVAIAPDGLTAITSGRDKSLRRWNIADAKEVQRITGFGDDVFRVAVTKDGRIFSCSADRTARLHALAGGKLLKTFPDTPIGSIRLPFARRPTAWRRVHLTVRFASGTLRTARASSSFSRPPATKSRRSNWPLIPHRATRRRHAPPLRGPPRKSEFARRLGNSPGERLSPLVAHLRARHS